VSLNFFEAIGSSSPGGPKPCNDVLIPANGSVQFGLGNQCTLGPGEHWGLLIVSDVAAINAFYGYSRQQNNVGAGFSIEGFPIANFSVDTSHATGLKKITAAPTYKSNCFVTSLADSVTYDLKLFDETGAKVGNTVSDSLGPFQQRRYLDVFAAAGAIGDYTNIRAQFTRTSAGAQKLIGFCTLEDGSLNADFRIAKSPTPPGSPVAMVPWGGAVGTLPSNTLTYIFLGPKATVTLGASASVGAYGSAGLARQQTSPLTISIGVCYQNQAGPGSVTPLGTTTSINVDDKLISYGASGSAALPAGTYNVGFCANNTTSGAVNKNDTTSGFAIVTL
jgi:hypothetical protein